jgi:hypothetical protein
MKMPTITTRKEPDIRRILSHERRHLGMRGRPMAKLVSPASKIYGTMLRPGPHIARKLE